MSDDFDLRPDPRILPMLGEINLVQWKCGAELIDNAVDGFLATLRTGGQLDNPEIQVVSPLTDDPNGRFVVRDNGPGMSAEILEQAVRAGWSGNDPVGSLGMFGMGFNIATARLGTVTTVFTTRSGDHEWVGLKIDFDELQRQRHFRTPRLSEPKADPQQHGTRVTIEKLKPEQRQWFARSGNRTKLEKELSRVYAAMLRPHGMPLTVRLTVQGRALEGRRHCIWGGPGNPPRIQQTARTGAVDAFQPIDVKLDPRLFCQRCWVWLPLSEDNCPVCGKTDKVVRRERSVRGWIGIQRYLSETDYGIDILRHGRKIEIANKDLFSWWDGEREEKEYPIDDPRDRGRIVGEIHLDHCRVTYTKDRFDRTDPAWDDMVRIVRGEGPLRPEKASTRGYGVNESYLGRLFQVFRRSNPKVKQAPGWKNILVVPSNETAEEMAGKFHAGDPEFQTDDKWWALVEEADKQALLRQQGKGTPGTPPPPGPDEGIPGFGGPPPSPPGSGPAPAPASPIPPPSAPTVIPLLALTRQYNSDTTEQKWDVRAFQANDDHPELHKVRPWRLRRLPEGPHEFIVNPSHPVFASATLTPMDALLAELAWSAMDFIRREKPGDMTYGQVLADLRLKYATTTALDYAALANEARQTIAAVAATLARNIEPSDATVLFSDLGPDDQRAVLQKMATRGATNPQAVIGGGRFLEYAPPRAVADFFKRHPELFLDGKCWDADYATLEFPIPEATEMARSQVVRQYESLLSDAVWLAEQDRSDLAQSSRSRVLRAMYALELLEPTVETEAE